MKLTKIQQKLNESLLDAIRDGNSDLVRTKLLAGADVNARNNSLTALEIAELYNNFEAMQILLESGADTETKNNDYETPLISAVNLGKTDAIKLLIDHHANVNISNKYGDPLIMIAAQKCDVEVVKLLLENGIYVHAKDNNGESVFDVLHFIKNKDVIELLNGNYQENYFEQQKLLNGINEEHKFHASINF